MSEVEITILSVSTNPIPKPHTVYHVQLRLPTRSYTVMKRYSEFAKLVSDLEDAVGDNIPFKLPRKKLFGSSVNDNELIEERRFGLEKFLKDINKSSDARWRLTDVWRDFLGLSDGGRPYAPGKSSLLSSSSFSSSALITSSGKNISDPVAWLDTLHEVKTSLHEARRCLSDRDVLSTSDGMRNGVSESYSAAAEAKKNLVQCGSKIAMLERGLRELANTIGDGEIRRRTDMLNMVRKEREGLEALASTVSRRPQQSQVASSDDNPERSALFTGGKGVLNSVANSAKRVLGPITETAETRPLDNRGLLNLQMNKMEEQDEVLLEFSKILARQKQIGIEINDELELQNEMLRMLDEDVESSDARLNRAGKKLQKIK
ncbi:hypothetical protein V1511DRAFT_44502 [Dipodascopsis uninucleata]